MKSDRVRNVLSLAVICGFTLMLAGTSKPGSSSSTSPSPSPLPNPTPTQQTGLGTPTTAPDADLFAVKALINCPKSGHPACRLLTDFELGTTWSDTPASGSQAIWYGELTGIGGAGNMKKEFYFVQVEGTPDGPNASPRGHLPGSSAQTKDANDLMNAAKYNKPIPKNSAFTFIGSVGGGMKKLVKSSAISTEFLIETPRMTYMRRIGNRLLVLEYTGSAVTHNSINANAWIGETWLVSR